MKLAKRAKRGVTLVEIAIVLVIIGLLLGGILKGQELINNAKVKNMIGYQESLRASWYAFIDRYEAVPGDWTRASQFLAVNNVAVTDGAGDGFLNEDESPLVFTHLVAAGFIRCAVCDDGLGTNSPWIGNNNPSGDDTRPDTENSPTNSYGGVVAIFHDASYYHGRNSGRLQAQLLAHSGPRVPSNLARDVDNKIDDGFANAGDVRMNSFSSQENTGNAAPNRATAGSYTLLQDEAESCVGNGVGQSGPLDGNPSGVAINNGVNPDADTRSYPWRRADADGGPTYTNCGFSVRL